MLLRPLSLDLCGRSNAFLALLLISLAAKLTKSIEALTTKMQQ